MQSIIPTILLSSIAGMSHNPLTISDNESVALPIDSTMPALQLDEVEIVAPVKEKSRLRWQPSAVSIISRQQLEASHVASIKDISALVPNFFMPDYGSRLTSAIYIRSIGSRMNTPAVGMYVDNVPFVDKSSFDFNLFDIERVDVLRGPQGTLYGRNTMGGIVRVFTKNPFSYEGFDVNLGYASGDHHRSASVTHYHRLSDKFAFSGGGYYEGGSGFFKNSFTQKKADNLESGGARVRGIYRPDERWDADFSLSFDYNNERAYPYFYATPSADALIAEDYIGSICNNRESTYRRGLLNAGLNLQYKAPTVTMNAITGYQYLNDRMFMDQDFLPQDIYTLEQKQRINTISEEITLKNNDKAQRWQWVNGANILLQTLKTQAPVVFYKDGMDWLADNVNRLMPSMDKIKMLQGMGFSDMGINFNTCPLAMSGDYQTPTLDLALFHQSDIALTRQLTLTLGLRLDYERRWLDYYAPTNVDYAFTMTNSKNPKMSVSLDNLTSNILYDGKLKDDELSVLPKIALKHSFGSTANVYASVSLGERSGGYNLQMFSELLQGKLRVDMMDAIKGGVGNYLEQLVAHTPQMPAMIPDPEQPGSMISLPDYVVRTMDANMPHFSVPAAEQIAYKPEYSLNYEVGSHINLKRLQIDCAAFLIDTRDQQIARFAPSGLGRMMVNAGKSRSLGAELTALWQPNHHWAVTANYGYNHAKFKDYDAGDEKDYTGNYVPFVPQHTLHVETSYTWNFRHTGFAKSLTVGANVRGNGKLYWTEDNTSSQDFYALLGSRIALDTSIATFQLWARNLTNNHYNTFYFISAERGFEQHGKPLQIGIDVRFRLKKK